MASFTSTGWVAGETVSVFLVSLTPPGGATGSAVTTATADSAGAAAFSGLTEDTQYIASGGTSNRTARFRVPTPVSAQSGHVVEDEGTPLSARSKLNFTGAGVTATDNPGADSTDISISGAGVSDASTTVKGVTKLATAPVSASAPIAVGDNDPRVTADQATGTASIRTLGTGAAQAAAGDHTHTNLPATGEKAALAGTGGTPGSGNKYVTDADSRLASLAVVTKRVTTPLNGAGTVGVLAAFTNFTHRWPVLLPVTTSRWRLRIRNRDSIGGAAQTGAISFTGAWVGTPLFAGTGMWNGDFTGAPASALGAFVTDAAGAEYTSAWVTDPTLQFTARTYRALSVGATLSAATPVVRSNTGQILRYSVDGTDAAAQASSATLSAGSPTTGTGILDIRMEYEFITPAIGGQKVVLGIGDSILERVTGAGSQAFQHEAWIGAAGLRSGFAWINLGVGGALSADFVAGTDWRWARADLATTIPDVAIISLGYNDASNGVTLATYKTNLNSVIANVRALGVQVIWLATTIPGSLGDAEDQLRVSYNGYVRELPFGVVGCVDHDLIMRDYSDTSSPFSPLPILSSTPPHPLLAGYQAMGAISGVVTRDG